MNETQEIEFYLNNRMEADERLFMDAKLIINVKLREKMFWQKQSYSLVQQYGRKKLRAEIERVHKKLFSENKYKGFSEMILSIFKK